MLYIKLVSSSHKLPWVTNMFENPSKTTSQWCFNNKHHQVAKIINNII